MYRGDVRDHQQLVSHLAIAADQLAICDRVPEWIASLRDGRGVTNELFAKIARDWAEAWERTWQQLDEARGLVLAWGRDVAAFDAARAAAGDIWNDVAKGRAVAMGNTVEWSWQNTSTQPAHDAIAALRAAVPEVVAMQSAPVDVDLSPASHKVVGALQVGGGIAVVGLAVYVLLHLFVW